MTDTPDLLAVAERLENRAAIWWAAASKGGAGEVSEVYRQRSDDLRLAATILRKVHEGWSSGALAWAASDAYTEAAREYYRILMDLQRLAADGASLATEGEDK